MDVLARIKYYMDLRQWNNYRLAKTIGKPTNTISDMFGRNTCPTIPTLQSICDAFHITLSEFFTESGTAINIEESQLQILDVYRSLGEYEKGLADSYLYGLARLPHRPIETEEAPNNET